MTRADKWFNVTTGLLTVTIISGYVVSRFAPRVGSTIALTSYLLAGAASIVGVVCVFKDDES